MRKRFTAPTVASILLAGIATAADAQCLGSQSLSKAPSDIEANSGRVQAVIDKSENYFKQGEIYLKERNYDSARAEFDKAVDTVLESGLDVRANPRLQTFYLQLVERISRMEIPIRKYASQQQQQGGFAREQKFTPSPHDELSRLELSTEEMIPVDSVRTDSQNCNAPVTVTAKAGETIAQIAARHGVDAGEVARLNAYAVDAPLASNQMIKVPANSGIGTTNGTAGEAAMRKIALRGFRLGMTLAEVRRRLPQLRVKGGAHGLTTGVAFSGAKPTNSELKGLTGIGFTLLDGQVVGIVIGYDDSIRWESLDEFARRTAEALKLPARWQSVDINSEPRRALVCGDLSLSASFATPYSRSKGPILHLGDARAWRVYRLRLEAAAERRRLEEERRKQSFKP